MSALAQFLLTQAFSIINSVIAAEGPAVIAFIQAEITAFESKFAPPPAAPAPVPAPPATPAA